MLIIFLRENEARGSARGWVFVSFSLILGEPGWCAFRCGRTMWVLQQVTVCPCLAAAAASLPLSSTSSSYSSSSPYGRLDSGCQSHDQKAAYPFLRDSKVKAFCLIIHGTRDNLTRQTSQRERKVFYTWNAIYGVDYALCLAYIFM